VYRDQFITVGEDCFLKIWQLTEINQQMKIVPIHSERIVDYFITGVKINKKNNDICAVAYDNSEIFIYKTK
jgi:hypothetical protein